MVNPPRKLNLRNGSIEEKKQNEFNERGRRRLLIPFTDSEYPSYHPLGNPTQPQHSTRLRHSENAGPAPLVTPAVFQSQRCLFK